MKTTCYECGKGMLARKRVRYARHGVTLGVFQAEVCSQCGEQFFTSDASDAIERAAQRAKVWALSTRTRVGKSGNSLDVRLTSKLARFVGLEKGDEVVIRPEGKKRLVIELT